MSSDDPREPTPEGGPPQPPCRNLRHNGMYLSSGGADDASRDYSTSVFWCVKTMKGFGPDDDFVAYDDCRDASRTCYQPL